MENIFIVGCGYIGSRVSRLERLEGSRVAAMVRSESSVDLLEQEGIKVFMGDLDDAASLNGLPLEKALVYYFAPPPSEGVVDLRMDRFLSSIDPSSLPGRVVLISTTGVYGNCGGDWVTEGRPAAPEADRAKRRLSAETILRSWGEANSIPVIMLRVPGIYGPGKLPEKRLREGLPVLREEDSPFSNRVHADDLARACVAAARRGEGGGIYNISDGHPTTMTNYFYKVADHLGLPRPPAISLDEARRQLSAGMLSYLAESKRLDNRKMREELGVEPLYPDLDSGLPSCLYK
ncbi:MAG: SDR family oxidoreductase [bacterium]|nr:SDR family oxidoreductase [bacterium]